MLMPDENGRRINRIMLEKVDGAWQGASTLFLNTKQLRAGGVRILMDDSKNDLLRIRSRLAKTGRRLATDHLQWKNSFSNQGLQADNQGFKLGLHFHSLSLKN